MKRYAYNDVEALQELVSDEFGSWSGQVEITQTLVDQFAALTGDTYWIHTDPEKAKTDSYEVTGYNNILNYGSDKLRFIGPVPVGSAVHCRSRVKGVTATPKGTKLLMEQHIHVVGQDERPVLVYEMIIIYM
jgi:acyl dehydratase